MKKLTVCRGLAGGLRKLALGLLIAGVLAPGFGLSVFAQGYEANYDESYYSKFRDQGIEINVYNWGEYLSDGEDGLMDINAEFEKLTGIHVNYTQYETNEAMYAKLKSGANSYDVIIPSDYMISRLIEEGMVQPIDFDNVPNMKYIDPTLLNPTYDPEQLYSIPYAYNRVCIIYNRDMVDYEVDSWDVLWDEDLAGQILMFKNSRDAFGVALMKLGYSINTEDPQQIQEAADLLKEQKPLVQAYVMDQVFDKMQGNEAAVAAYYVGDYYIMKEVNDSLEMFIPQPTELFMDAACIPSDAQNKEAAEMYLNFLNEPNVAAENMEYIMYSSPNTGAVALLDEEISGNTDLYAPPEVLANTEVFIHLSEETNLLLDELWTDILSDDASYLNWVMPVFVILAIVVIGASLILRSKKKKNAKD